MSQSARFDLWFGLNRGQTSIACTILDLTPVLLGGCNTTGSFVSRYFFATPSAASFFAMSSPAVLTLTALSISRILPSGPM